MYSEKLKKIMVVFLVVTCRLSLVSAGYAEVRERIVAIVNDDIILFSEFQNALQSERESDSAVSGGKVLNDMIDNMLLLNEAKKYRISTSDRTRKNETANSIIVREYIDRRIKALIHVPYGDIEHYYQMNRDLYRGKDIIDVRDEIEEQLVKVELKTKIREHIEELRKKSYVRIQLNAEN